MSKFTVKNLQSIRRNIILFENINFELNDGDLLQIDGVNGSGKSTILRICAGLSLANEGTVLWNNKTINNYRYEYQQHMTYIGHKNAIKNSLTAKENIEIINALSKNNKSLNTDNILKKIGLLGMENVLLHKMSAGQKRRIGLTRLLINSSKLWLLDEPFTSLDFSGKALVENLIVNHCKNNGIVIFATHQKMDIKDQTIKCLHLGKN